MSRLRVALIGGSGFVGTNLARHFMEQGAEVTLINRGTRLVAGTRHIACDRKDAASLAEARAQLPETDFVVDCCAYDANEAEAAFNALGSKTGQWFHISSASVYANSAHEVPDESAETGGARVWGAYGTNKSAIDELYLSLHADKPVRIIRPPYIYGPGNDSDRETFVWARCRRRQPVLVPGDGTTKMQFIHARDLAQIILDLAQANPSEKASVFNVGDKVFLSQVDWAKTAAAAAGYADPTVCVGERMDVASARSHFPFRAHPCVLDTSRLENTLPNIPSREFAPALAQIYEGTSLALLDDGSALSDVEKRLVNEIHEGR